MAYMGKVFPASAGMIRRDLKSAQGLLGVPRIRGDDPAQVMAGRTAKECSPHPRG